MKNLTLKILTLSTLTSTFLLGAVPNIGTVEKEIKIPDIKKEQQALPTIKTKEYKTPMSDSGKLILVKDFTLSGNEHIKTSDLEKFYSEFKNKELTFNQIQSIASAITKYYREQGYFVARAYIPAQNILENNNVLEIVVIEGNYGKFKLNNDSIVKDSVVQNMLNNAKARDNVISNNTLERAMLIINDTPGVVVVNADIMPGSVVGTSDFEISTQKSARVDGYVVTDNTGSIYTGKYRLMSGVNINSPFSIGDKISVFGLLSNGTNLKNGKIAYSLPLMPNGLKSEISYTQTNYSLTDTYEALDAIGTSKTYNLNLSYPIIRTRLENLYSTLDISYKDLEDEVKSTSTLTSKNSTSVKLGLNYDKNYLAFNKNSNSNVNLSLTYGNLDNPTADTDGNYSKVNLDLGNSINLNQKLSLETNLSTQYTLGNKNLDGSEDFSVGGSSGVKLYPDGELSSENGYQLSIEAKYQLPTFLNMSNTIGVFYDIGRAYMKDKSKDLTFTARTLQDVGIGIYTSKNQFFSKLQAAWKIDSQDVTSEEDRDFRFLYQIGMSF